MQSQGCLFRLTRLTKHRLRLRQLTLGLSLEPGVVGAHLRCGSYTNIGGFAAGSTPNGMSLTPEMLIDPEITSPLHEIVLIPLPPPTLPNLPSFFLPFLRERLNLAVASP